MQLVNGFWLPLMLISYPGETTKVHESSLQIKVMERAGGNYQIAKKGRQYILQHRKCC